MRFLSISLIFFLMTGCASMKYNGSDTEINEVMKPLHNTPLTAYVGDHLYEQGYRTETKHLVVLDRVLHGFMEIPVGTYKQYGYDNKYEYFDGREAVERNLGDHVLGLRIEKDTQSNLCGVTISGLTYCVKGANYDIQYLPTEKGLTFMQTLIYNGRVGDKINVAYREFSNDTARQAFSNEVEYDLSMSSEIGYKGAVIRVISADNNSINYEVLEGFK